MKQKWHVFLFWAFSLSNMRIYCFFCLVSSHVKTWFWALGNLAAHYLQIFIIFHCFVKHIVSSRFIKQITETIHPVILPFRYWWTWFEDPASCRHCRKRSPDLLHWCVGEIQASLQQLQRVVHRLHQNHRAEALWGREAFLVSALEQRAHLQGELWRLVLHTRWKLPHAVAGGRCFGLIGEGDQGIAGERTQGKS